MGHSGGCRRVGSVTSLLALVNSRMASPTLRARAGRFFPPKRKRAMNRMMRTSGPARLKRVAMIIRGGGSGSCGAGSRGNQRLWSLSIREKGDLLAENLHAHESMDADKKAA